MDSQIRHYVSLDLGSETMAAYYEEKESGRDGIMVNLQSHAEELLGDSVDLFTEEDGDVSPRLRTRLSLEPNRQPEQLPDGHATLDFIDASGKKLPGYDESLFSYFYRPGQGLSRKIMPNPKIPFQEGSIDIIPAVQPRGGPGEIKYAPETLLQHLTCQVVRNLVLKSPQLAAIPPEEIHLTLTVPNVYSVSHVESIRRFVEKNSGAGKVDALYESDAVAYYVLQPKKATDSRELREFNRKIFGRHHQAELRLVTIDVGRGTTDLSLIQINEPRNRGVPRQHFVLARTGRSTGGNQLSYIFAEYYNARLVETFRRFGHLIGSPPPFDPPFDLLRGPSQWWVPVGLEQGTVLNVIEELIEQVKRNLTASYKLRMTAESQLVLINRVVDLIIKAAEPVRFPELQAKSANRSKMDQKEQQAWDGFIQLGVELRKTFLLPRKLPGRWTRWLLNWRVLPWVTKVKPALRPELEKLIALGGLTDKIARYVEENTVKLINQLAEIALCRENTPPSARRRGFRSKVFGKHATFAVVAGQASQFEPIRRGIMRAFKSLNFRLRHVYFLPGRLAKEACCRGAVNFQRAKTKPMNSEELHGFYGFLCAVPTTMDDSFKPVDMAKLQKGRDTVTFRSPAQYKLVYTTRPLLSQDSPPELYDGFTAIVKNFEGNSFKVEYDSAAPEIRVNGVSIGKLATYGDINEAVYPKVWPEVLIRR